MAQTGSDMHIGTEEEHAPDAVHVQVDADRHHLGETGFCESTIMTMDLSKEMFLVGDVFMRRFYTVFDRANNRVGLATAITNDKMKASQTGAANLSELSQKKAEKQKTKK